MNEVLLYTVIAAGLALLVLSIAYIAQQATIARVRRNRDFYREGYERTRDKLNRLTATRDANLRNANRKRHEARLARETKQKQAVQRIAARIRGENV